MLKRLLFGILLFSALSTGVYAQGIEITPMTGYTFAAGFPISGGRAQLGDGQNWGGFLGIGLNDFTEVELSYSYMSTSATAFSRNLQVDVNTTTQVHYAMIGANRLFPVSEKATFFAGGKLGTGTLAFPNRDYRNLTRFSVGFQGGAKIFPSERIGLRVQASLLFPVLSTGASLWWSPGSGTAVGLTGWSPLVQFGFNGGLIFRMQK